MRGATRSAVNVTRATKSTGLAPRAGPTTGEKTARTRAKKRVNDVMLRQENANTAPLVFTEKGAI